MLSTHPHDLSEAMDAEDHVSKQWSCHDYRDNDMYLPVLVSMSCLIFRSSDCSAEAPSDERQQDTGLLASISE